MQENRITMNKRIGKINFIVEKTNTGYSAYASDDPVATTGKSFSELLLNATEAYNLYLEDTGMEIDEKNIKLEIDRELSNLHLFVQ